MMKEELETERKVCLAMGIAEGVACTKELITNQLKDAIQNGTIIISQGTDKLFEIIDSVGKP